MNLTRDECTLLMLYYSSGRPEAIRILKEMQACLMPDETELWLMTESLISKLLCERISSTIPKPELYMKHIARRATAKNSWRNTGKKSHFTRQRSRHLMRWSFRRSRGLRN